jgi:putative hydrolase of the HAD superfamily
VAGIANLDWDTIDFVAFDVDGTLYNQKKLRGLIARDLALSAMFRADATPMSVLKRFRARREQLAEMEAEDFAPRLIRETAAETGIAHDKVEAIIEQWIMTRPLRYLARCRYPAVARLFEGLRRAGKTVGILSDYPAEAKLRSMGLDVTHIVAATDPAVRRLKPHPKGLNVLIESAGTTAKRTLLIGDRYERDGIAAQRAGARYLIRTSLAATTFPAFRSFGDAVFAKFLT